MPGEEDISEIESPYIKRRKTKKKLKSWLLLESSERF